MLLGMLKSRKKKTQLFNTVVKKFVIGKLN